MNIQSFACLWGVVPGSVADEESPLNECAHAYLAAARALLLQLREATGVDHDAVEALIRKIEAEMLTNGASLTLCRYSDEPFNTNEVIWPHWGRLRPTLRAPYSPSSRLLRSREWREPAAQAKQSRDGAGRRLACVYPARRGERSPPRGRPIGREAGAA